MKKKGKKNVIITKNEHDEWHRQNPGWEGKNEKEHEECHKEKGIIVRG